MLLCHHGASTLGKILRRPVIVYIMNPESTPITSVRQKSTRAMMSNSSPKTPSPARPRVPQQPKTWHPNHGIRFSPGAGTPRLSTTAVDIEQDLMLHSHAEDNYILAPLHTTSKAPPSTEKPQAVNTKPEDPITYPSLPSEPPTQDPKYDTIPTSTSPWKATEPLFRAAKTAPQGTPESYWTHSLYRHIPSLSTSDQKIKVHYCKSLHTSERVMRTYFLDSPLLGFDIEWMQNASRTSGPKQNVSLIQIASEERVALFHIAVFPGTAISELVPPSLQTVLEDPDVTKVGVNIKGDCTRLRNNLSIHARGLFELSHLYKLIKFSSSRDFKLINKKPVSLATQVQEHLHLPLYKGESVRSGDWNRSLNLEQIRYAAADSYAGVQLFDTMEVKRRALEPTPPRPWHAELNLPIRIAEGVEIATDDEGEEEVETPVPVKRKYVRKAAVPGPVGGEEKEKDEA